jgi:hypothetical protein
MICACDEVRRNKSSKSGYENENSRAKRKRKAKNVMVGYLSTRGIVRFFGLGGLGNFL